MRSVYELAAELTCRSRSTSRRFLRQLHRAAEEPPRHAEGVSKNTFIGHSQCILANISADVPPGEAYPTGKVQPGGFNGPNAFRIPQFVTRPLATSGRNALGRDPIPAGFLARHRDKLMFGSDCPCRDASAGQTGQSPLIKGKCIARETLTALKQLTSPDFQPDHMINAHRLLKIKS